MKITQPLIRRFVCLICMTLAFLFSGCSSLQSNGGSSKLGLSKQKKLAIVPLRDAQRGDRLTSDDLGFRFVSYDSYTPLHLRLEECDQIETFALLSNVRQSQPLMRTHFKGL